MSHTRTRVTVADLPAYGSNLKGIVLHCTVCGEDNSADRGDYFMMQPDMVLMHCRRPMELAIRKVVYEPWPPIPDGPIRYSSYDLEVCPPIRMYHAECGMPDCLWSTDSRVENAVGVAAGEHLRDVHGIAP